MATMRVHLGEPIGMFGTMAGCPIRRARKAEVRAEDGSIIAFPRPAPPRAGLSHAQWRVLSPSEKLERLFGMSLDDMAEILIWGPVAELDPARLNAVVTIARVVLLIGAKGGLFEKAQRERDRESVIANLAREFRRGIPRVES